MMRFEDRSHILLEDVKTLSSGYKVIRSKVARTGIQYYRAHELGDAAYSRGFKQNDLVAVYRPPEEVFAKDSLNGWAGVPVTLNHPSELVTPENIKDYQIGNVRDKAHIDTEGGWVGLEYMLQNADGIASFDSGETPEVSGGYTAELVWGDGVADDGRNYHVKQTKITPNHLAMVRKGRAFSDSADNWGAIPVTVKDHEMTVELKTVILGDASVEVKASDAATVAGLLKDHKTELATLETKLDLKDAEITELKGKILSDADIDALVVKKIELNTKREAVKAKIGDKADKYDDAKIEMAFELLDHVPEKQDDTMRKALGDAAVIEDADAKIAAAQRKFLNLEAK